MLENVSCGILQVFIFTDDVEVALGVLVENDTFSKVDCVFLSFGLLALSSTAELALFLALADALVDHLRELSVVCIELGVVEDARQLIALLFVGCHQVAVEEFLLDNALEL